MEIKVFVIGGFLVLVLGVVLFQINSNNTSTTLWYNCQPVSSEIITVNNTIVVNGNSCAFSALPVADFTKYSFGEQSASSSQVNQIIFDNSCKSIESEISPYKQSARNYEGFYQNSEGKFYWCVGFSSGT